MKKYIVLLMAFTFSWSCAAENASTALIRAEPIGSGLGWMAISLFGVIIIMGALYWFARRFLMQRLGMGRRMQSMRILSVTMLGPKEKIIVLDTREGEALILGVTSQHISLLDKRPLEQAEH
jgi:flagellar protein FliO/FliZ